MTVGTPEARRLSSNAYCFATEVPEFSTTGGRYQATPEGVLGKVTCPGNYSPDCCVVMVRSTNSTQILGNVEYDRITLPKKYLGVVDCDLKIILEC